jgi:riboflavin kinase/FMN adenylyltransferase
VKVYTRTEDIQKITRPVLTTGTFDGVHLGHRKIIARLAELAKSSEGESVVLTFHPHPRMILYPEDNTLKLLSTLDEKISLLEEAGVQHLIIYPFTKEFSRLSSLDFVRDVLVNQIGTQKLVIGYNHHFGRNREGSFEHLKECGPVYGFTVEEIPAQDVDQVEVSSTKIRQSLLEGDVSTAKAYLGRAYSFSGLVVKGKQLGRTLGYPTANLLIADTHKLVPGDGIYAVLAELDGVSWKGMMSIGLNPTVQGKERTVEVNILNFEGDLYGRTLTITCIQRIRDEQKFAGLEELKIQLGLDRESTLTIFASMPSN